MREVVMIDRRNFIVRAYQTALAFLATWILPARKSFAEDAYVPDPDFVHKTRKGKFSKFHINYWKPMRRIQEKNWTLEVTGLCENPRRFTLDEIKALPSHTQSSRLKCVECWSARAEWTGVPLAELEKLIRPTAEAKGVLFHCGDAYVEHLARESLNHERTMLVYGMNGERLSDEHGFPLRIIAPFKYGYKNPKAILRMEYVTEAVYGTWSKIGAYSPDGTILPGTDHPLEFDKKPRRIPGGEITGY